MTGDDILSLLNSTLNLGAASEVKQLSLTGSGQVNTTGDLKLSGTSSLANSSVLNGPGKILLTGTLNTSGGPTIQTQTQVTGTFSTNSTNLFISGPTAKIRVLSGGQFNFTNSALNNANGGLGVAVETGGNLTDIGTGSARGALSIDGGTAKVINDPTFGGSLQFNAAASLNNATFDVASGANVVFNSNVANLVSGTITGTGVGQVVISGDSSFALASNTTFNFAAGQLQFQNNAAIVGPGTLTNKGNLSGAPVIKTKVISTGSVTTAGSLIFASSTAELRITDGTSFTPTGANVYSTVVDAKGLVIESGGTISAANGGISISALLTVQPGGKLKTSPNGGIQIYGVANLDGPDFDISGNAIFFQGGSAVTASGTFGTIVTDGVGGFIVQGSHKYVVNGTYNTTVAVLDEGGATITLHGVATVADAPLAPIGRSFTATHGLSFTKVIGSFGDADSSNRNASIYRVLIDWGDGTAKTLGTVKFNTATFKWDVTGTHKYTLKSPVGGYRVKILVTDGFGKLPPFSQSTTIASTAIVS